MVGLLTERLGLLMLGAATPTLPPFTDGKFAATVGDWADGVPADPPKTPRP